MDNILYFYYFFSKIIPIVKDLIFVKFSCIKNSIMVSELNLIDTCETVFLYNRKDLIPLLQLINKGGEITLNN